MYLLPAIDILEGKAVRLAKGDYAQVTIYNEDPVAQAQLFEEAGASWIHVVDLDGARSGSTENIDLIERILRKTLLKVEIGGGIRNKETIQRLYDAGVSRIVLGTSLISDPAFAQDAVDTYKDLLACGVDAKEGEVAVAGWQENAGIQAETLVGQLASKGFKHLVYTDIARDGMQTGIDPSAYKRIADIFGNPVVVSGGVAGIDDIIALGAVASSVEGVIVGRAIYEKSFEVAEGIRMCAEMTQKAEAALCEESCCGTCSRR